MTEYSVLLVMMSLCAYFIFLNLDLYNNPKSAGFIASNSHIPNISMPFVLQTPVPKSFKFFAFQMYSYESWAFYMKLYNTYRYFDMYVLGVTNISHQGNPMGYSFWPFEQEIQQFRKQLFIYNVDISDIPHDITKSHEREIAQRVRMVNALPLIGATGHDLVFIADSDEFPLPETMERIVQIANQIQTPISLTSLGFYGSFRNLQTRSWVVGGIFWTDRMQSKNLNELRNNGRPAPNGEKLVGVHLSSFFPTISRLQLKLNSFFHYDLVPENAFNRALMWKNMYCNFDALNRRGANFGRTPWLEDPGEKYFYLIPDLNDYRFEFAKGRGFFDDIDTVNESDLAEFSGACPNCCQKPFEETKAHILKLRQESKFNLSEDPLVDAKYLNHKRNR